ncbi:DUF262 domain-containing protein [Microbacterium sp.]|uniref:DUF262 domain-containing protein n=1 Tax=Microbacterium sp. TaxID=51671 RepID=UPI003525765C
MARRFGAGDELQSEGDGPGHFLGSLVLAPTKAIVGGAQRWVVIDGQQRLTTLTLALCALRDHVREATHGCQIGLTRTARRNFTRATHRHRMASPSRARLQRGGDRVFS